MEDDMKFLEDIRQELHEGLDDEFGFRVANLALTDTNANQNVDTNVDPNVDTNADPNVDVDVFGSDANVTSVETEKTNAIRNLAKSYLKKNQTAKKGCCKADEQKENPDGSSSCPCPSHDHDPNPNPSDLGKRLAAAPAISVLVLGDSGVGKTAFLNRHMTGQATKVHEATTQVGVAQLLFATNYGYIKIHYIDTMGTNPTLGGLEESYYHAVQCVMIMFDVTDPGSYKNATQHWLEEADKLHPTLPKVLVGNKCDLEEDRKIHRSDITFHKTKEKHRSYFDLSVATLTNIEIPFLCLLLAVTGIRDLHFVQPEHSSEKDKNKDHGGVPLLPEVPGTPPGTATRT
jgi:GTP-binding nuclear protein Ran